MTRTTATPSARAAIQPLFDPGAVSQLLRADAGIEWPGGMKPVDVRIERGWPTHDGKFSVEWSFVLGRGQRHVLFGLSCDDSDADDQQRAKPPIVTPSGVRGVLVDVPKWGVRIHSPDCDLGLPHLARCLDEHEMAERLAPYWGTDFLPARRDTLVECRPLGYRAGRRATIAYQSLETTGESRRVRLPARRDTLLGKTYRDDRGERLLRLHSDLNEQLCKSSNGRVQVSTPVGFLPDLRMMLFAWSPGRKVKAGSTALTDDATAAVDALTVLHGCKIKGLPNFTVADECAVISRWHGTLERINTRLADSSQSLLDTLQQAAESVDTSRRCTLHRDFYERQFTYTREVTTLLDLDTLARGNPCVDLGNLLAHLWLVTLSSTRTPSDYASLATSMVRRYMGGGGAVDRRSLAFYWASALFRVGAVHSVRTTTKVYAPSLWRLSAELLRNIGFPMSCVPLLEAVPPFDSGVALPDLQPFFEELRS